jgi:adenylylsulfate kinase-like enzyme
MKDCVTVTLTGESGSGKTCLAMWSAKMLTARGNKVELSTEVASRRQACR